ncbi:hypothetical protein LCGC14_1838250 [marine sediment metagenome]|uniref:Uncharacterized protein n=1 Tax=marine sediment metagenome TaxID=412755 RepID=A0A0F9GE40_9ZZZZ
MQYVDSWLFNRGQEITLWRGPKIWRVSVQLFNSEGFPFKYLEDRDKERVLLRALSLIKRDAAKDGQDVVYLDQAHEHDTALEVFPVKVRTESEELEEFVQSPSVQAIIGEMRTNIRLGQIERDSYDG